MKTSTLHRLWVLALAAILLPGLLTSCSKDDEDGVSDKKAGTATATINGKSVDVNWVQLWEEGPRFAEFNVGAASIREYGAHYTWGGFKDCGNYYGKDYNQGVEELAGDYDTATMLWGKNWRMPSKIEYEALIVKCDAEWVENYNNTGIAGCLFIGRGEYSSNKVFFPEEEDGWSSYWTSTPYNEYNGYYFFIETGKRDLDLDLGEISRSDNNYVRAVRK